MGIACAPVLTALRSVSPQDRMKLDPYLSSRAEALVLTIRRRAVVQHMSVYARVDLRAMASAFGMEVSALEHDLAALIAKGTVRARIDADAMVRSGRERGGVLPVAVLNEAPLHRLRRRSPHWGLSARRWPWPAWTTSARRCCAR